MKRKNIFKTFGILLVLVMVIGSIPASAKGKEIIVTASKNKIMKALDLYGDTPATIIIKSDTRKKITIPAMEYSIYKKLVIDAPNLTLVNYTPLQSVTIKAADTYIEPMPDNRIILENPDTKIILGERFYCKVVVKSKKAVITLRKNSGKVNINVDKKDADVSFNIEKKSQGIININKKSNITISGSKKNLISISNIAENSKLTTYIPVSIKAEANMEINLEAGSEGSIIKKTNDDIKLIINNNTAVPVTETITNQSLDPTIIELLHTLIARVLKNR